MLNEKELQYEADPERLQEAVGEFQSEHPLKPAHKPHARSRSVREVSYLGRQIRIETSYKITVDGEPVLGHVMVGNNGLVHYHSIPNQEFVSAVDMVKSVVELLPPSYSNTYEKEV